MGSDSEHQEILPKGVASRLVARSLRAAFTVTLSSLITVPLTRQHDDATTRRRDETLDSWILALCVRGIAGRGRQCRGREIRDHTHRWCLSGACDPGLRPPPPREARCRELEPWHPYVGLTATAHCPGANSPTGKWRHRATRGGRHRCSDQHSPRRVVVSSRRRVGPPQAPWTSVQPSFPYSLHFAERAGGEVNCRLSARSPLISVIGPKTG